jgi:hypothetical protein
MSPITLTYTAASAEEFKELCGFLQTGGYLFRPSVAREPREPKDESVSTEKGEHELEFLRVSGLSKLKCTRAELARINAGEIDREGVALERITKGNYSQPDTDTTTVNIDDAAADIHGPIGRDPLD